MHGQDSVLYTINKIFPTFSLNVNYRYPQCKHSVLVYVHMYAAYVIRRPICDGEFFPKLLNIL